MQSSIFGATQDVTTAFEGKKPALALIRPKSFAAESGGGGPATVSPDRRRTSPTSTAPSG